jgi:serine/threonine protein kinase
MRVDIHTMDQKLFNREVQSLLKIIEHPNVVRFLVFYSNTHHEAVKENTGVSEKRCLVEIRERLLCFEYISNGSLEKYITGRTTNIDFKRHWFYFRDGSKGVPCPEINSPGVQEHGSLLEMDFQRLVS